MKIKYPQALLSNEGFNNDNLHRIAISNLQDHERQVIRWWCKKYRTPQKPFGEHTMEELIVEMLEDFYERNPQEIGKFVARSLEEPEWDGTMPPEYEAEIQKRLEKINKRQRIDIEQFRSDEELSDEEAQKIIDNLGRNLPRSRMMTKKDEADTISEDEFEESF